MESVQPEILDQIVVLKKRKIAIQDRIKDGRKEWRAQASFDMVFWTQAVKIEELELKRHDIDRRISISMSGVSESQWRDTPQAQRIFEQTRASEQTKRSYEKRIEQFGHQRNPIRATFMRLFTTSKLGLDISTTGAGARNPQEQSKFREALIESHQAKQPVTDYLWCPIMGEYLDDDAVIAGHLFPWKHGQKNMDAIFGEQAEPELFSPRNGLLIAQHIEKVLDIGKLAIVPYISESTGFCLDNIKSWIANQQREYQVKILDPKWDRLDTRIYSFSSLTFRDLDGRKLQFLSSFRPAARYVYFHYCIQVLRLAWQHNEAKSGRKAADALKDENGKPFWGTPGRYLPKNMLLAFVEELGHEYKSLLDGAASIKKGDSDLLLNIAANQVKSRPSILVKSWEQEDLGLDSDCDDSFQEDLRLDSDCDDSF
ncbi:uncharacterized protein N7473_011673 [Penicillium subrubescens]|uniref:uncharacterized protein n=1 Tax=Penicillium subrubescens TaxID=1316194 RepID=UPI0025454F09|nr:uncharacterized protein N7473_011673 [Penicillium subrubescens]KAJ5880620.1 hypothetical protein N7473_011673 [Penicillium subrubescens]